MVSIRRATSRSTHLGPIRHDCNHSVPLRHDVVSAARALVRGFIRRSSLGNMGNIAIRAEGLSKRYRIGERQKYKALRDTLTAAIYSPFRKVRRMFANTNAEIPAEDNIWALKDVSFE